MNRISAPSVILILALIPAGLWSCHPAALPKGQDAGSWYHLEPGDRMAAGGFELFLKKSEGGATNLYLRESAGQPFRFLTGEIRLSADILVSPGRRYLMINASCSTRSRCVFIAEARSGTTRMISGGATRSYVENAAPDGSFFPVGDSFSPDDSMVLIRMIPGDGTGTVGFKRWSYGVDAADGTIRREIRTEPLPGRWWEPGEPETPSPGGFY